MSFRFTPEPLAVLAVWVLASALALVILLAAPRDVRNRVLAGFVFLEISHLAVTWVTDAWWLDARTQGAAEVASAAYVVPSVLCYLMFLGTLPTPLVRPFSTRSVRWLLTLLAVTWPFIVLTWSEAFRGSRLVRADDGLVWQAEAAPGWDVIQMVSLLAFVYGLIVALHVWLQAPHGSQARRQGRHYATAFIVKDLGIAVILVLLLTDNLPAGYVAAGLLSFPTLTVFYVLVAYGILHVQMLDIDLKIKLGISRTTVAAVIAGAALVGGEATERLLGVESLWGAVAIGGVTALAFRPLARFGDRLADKALPGVEESPAYRDRRKQEIYAAALAEAEQDGLTAKEQAGLEALRTRLGLPAT